MAQLTKQALIVENNESFPNNTTGAITPTILRNFNTDIIDSTVNQTQYTADSGSWTNKIATLQAFTASQQPSFTALNAFTASQLTINTGYNTATQSLSASIAPLQPQITSLQNFTSSINEIRDDGVLQGYSTRFYFNGLVSASIVPNVGGAIANVTIEQDGTKLNTSSFDAYTTSNNTKWSTLGGQTGSYVTSAITGSSLITASVSGNTVTFTKGNGTQFGLTIATGSGGDLTSLNAFTQSQDTKNSTLATYTASVDTKFTAVGSSTASLNSFSASQITKDSTLATYTGSNDTKWSNLGSQSGSFVTESETGSFARTNVDNNFSANQTFTNITAVSASFTYVQTLYETSSVIYSSGSNQFGDELTDIQTLSGSVRVQGNLTINGTPVQTSSVDISSLNAFTQSQETKNNTLGSYTASVDTKFVAVGSSTASLNSYTSSQDTKNSTLATYTGSVDTKFIAVGSSTASLNAFTSSQDTKNSTLATYTASVDTQFTTIGLLTGSYATTGSNNFKGVETIGDIVGTGTGEVYLLGRSGSLVLGASGLTPTYAALAHLSSSVVNSNVNLIIKNSTAAVDTIVSGSANIFPNPTATTAGFKRYIGTSNYYTHGNSIPQLSGSMAWSPTTNGNIISNTTTNAVTWRGPVSSSASSINHNILMGGQIILGTSATLNHEKAISGVNAIGNALFNGNINSNAYVNTLSSSLNIAGNLVFGAQVTLNHNSSSLTYTSNVQNGGITVNNNYTPISGSSAGVLNARVSTNTVYGTGHLLNINGSNGVVSQTKQFSYNILAGTFLTASVGDGDASAVLGTGIIGNGLIVTGSTSPSTALGADTANVSQGSVFVGRFNAQDGSKSKTAETVLAVGTGTGYGNRKTGFLVDSGSNTFVEGTLNVSGSTSTTGSITIQSGSGDLFVHGHKQFNVGAFTSTITQSGSAAVSQSMTFNVTDISQGVTLNGGGSQLTLTNAGTYNIQFSIQILSGTGGDNVWVWLKKNGSNVSNTAGKVVLANNDELITAWNYIVEAAAGDYYELAWQNANGHAELIYQAATGNIPAIPSAIVTVTQVR